MSEVIIPSAPHWYKPLTITCTADGALIYASKNDLVIIEENDGSRPEIKIIHSAHFDFILSVSVNRKWKAPNAHCVSMGEDGTVKIWNVLNLSKVFMNNAHKDHKDSVVGAVFAGEDRVISVATNGFLVVWNFMSNEVKLIKKLFKQKVVVTCLSSCPHAAWLVAIGLNTGGVVIADLKSEGKILYNLRGHYQSVVNLSWCPVPVNVFPRKPCNTVGVANPSKFGQSEKTLSESNNLKISINTVDGEREILTVKKIENTDIISPSINKEDGEDNLFSNSVKHFLYEALEDKITKVETGSYALSSDSTVLSPCKPNMEFCETTKDISVLENAISSIDETFHTYKDNNSYALTEPTEAFSGKKEVYNYNFILKKDSAEFNEEKSIIKTNDFEKEQWESDSRANKKNIVKHRINNEHAQSNLNSDKATELSNLNEAAKNKSIAFDECNLVIEDHSCEHNNKNVATSDLNNSNTKPVTPTEHVGENIYKHLITDSLIVESKRIVSECLIDSTEVSKSKFENSECEHVEYTDGEKAIGTLIVEPEIVNDLSECANTSPNRISYENDELLVQENEKEMNTEIPRVEYLLASSGRDGSVYIWRAGTDGRMQTFFNISSKYKKGRGKQKTKNIDWISLCWISPNNLLTSTMNGQVLSWIMPKPQMGNNSNDIIHENHSTIIFNLVAPQKLWTSCNWHDKDDKLLFWSWGYDGKLIKCDLKTKEVILSLATVSSSIIAVEALPQDPNRFGIGCKDGNIYTWDLSVVSTNVVKTKKHSFRENQKLSAISWHPFREMLLGYGTEEGRVGYIDINSYKNVLLTHYFNTNVYKVQWGPVLGKLEFTGLYVVANGKLVVYDVDHPKQDPTEISLPATSDVYRFVWKPDYSILLINTKDGTLYVLNDKLSLISHSVVYNKGFNDIVWHPDSTGKSSRSNWFATARPGGVTVYNCVGEQKKEESLLNNIVASFEGHVKPPVVLAWCPFQGDRIASIATDGITHVWDTTAKTLLSTFINSYQSAYVTLTWSPFNSDLIVVADKVLSFWSIEKNLPINDKELLPKSRKILNKNCIVFQDGKERVKDMRGKIHNGILSTFYTSSSDQFSHQVTQMKKLKSYVEDSHIWDESDSDPLQIFGNEEQITSLLKVNYDKHKMDKKFQFCDHIALWNGTAAQHIQDAIAENRVTPTMISYAPMFSIKLWQEACSSYADKLIDSDTSDPLEAAQYLLACHKVEEAVKYLSNSCRFKEALALARRRFGSESKITKEITEKWAEFSINIGNFETAAYCYISMKQYENAAKILSKRKNTEFLKFALELVDGNSALAESILFKLDEINSQAEPNSQTNETNQSGRSKTEDFQCDDSDLMQLKEVPLDVSNDQVTLLKEDLTTLDNNFNTGKCVD